MTPGKAVAIVLGSAAGCLVIAVAVMAIWNLGWFAADAAARQQGKLNNINARNTQQGVGNQAGEQSTMENDLQTLGTIRLELLGVGIYAPKPTGHARQSLIASQVSTASDACTAGAQLNSDYLRGADRTWFNANCTGSQLSISSPLRN